MNYLLDKKNKKRKISRIIFGVIILFFVFYFRAGITRGLTSFSHAIFRPILFIGRNASEEVSSIHSFFYSKKTLFLENKNLKSQISEIEASRANYASILDENNKLKEVLGRKSTSINMVLAGILNKPNRSLYDTLLVDAGKEQGIVVGQKVFAFGNVPIGYTAEVYTNSSKVILYSNPGEKTEVVISGKDAFMEVTGRGGGNFEMVLPRDFVLPISTEIDLPGITPHILGTVQNIISDSRDSFQKALIASPVNIFELKFVEIEL